jgi:GxxExxY protein
VDVEELASITVDCGFHLHKELGPGLLESVYEAIMADQLARRGLDVLRQVPVPVRYGGVELPEGFRADLLVEGQLLVELKSVERLSPLHGKQVPTYLRLLEMPLGLLINFGGETFKEGVRRIVNNHRP